jgi:small-conductance mechanosensitive channel
MYENEPVPQTSSSKGALIVVLVAVLALGSLGIFAFRERNQASRMAAQNDQLVAALKDTRSQVESVTARLDQMTAAQQKAEQDATAARQQTRRVTVQRRRVDDSRWKQMQSKLDEQNKALESTRTDLTNALNGAKTELGNSIARTHDELVVLQRRGERNYYEFDLDKSKNFQQAGPFGLSLRKASTKDKFADLKLIVDDAQLTQKHVNLYQPVVFYAGDSGQPVELVINSVTKNHVHGYISEPKYKQSDLTAMQNSAVSGSSTGAQPQSAPLLRQRLPSPTR